MLVHAGPQGRLPAKHMQHIGLAHEYLPLAQIDGTGRLNIEVDHLYE